MRTKCNLLAKGMIAVSKNRFICLNGLVCIAGKLTYRYWFGNEA
jgi:hypothetical protein